MLHLHSTDVTHRSSLVPLITVCYAWWSLLYLICEICAFGGTDLTLLCRESIVLTASLPTFGRLWSEKAIRMCYWLIFLLGLSFHFSYRAVGNRWVKQQTCRYSGFKREKNPALYSRWFPSPPFILKDLRLVHSTGGLLGDWQAGVFHHFHTLCEEGYLDNCEKKVRFWVDRWSREPIIYVSVKV